ncbi:glycosyl transferase [Bdellovibrio bacteriovorus]|uniref:Glycosyl transferase n=1 Tax=Bdellovibrio bacteriovorus TaxID=959 RepID=A0A162GFZ8_BDEBC|nr:glycosyltransferase family 1 protein [Bdellovibrio bacteriovorus]KYG68055.1 glycosyl transferase [Bdellovibrio bacteriovorus]
MSLTCEASDLLVFSHLRWNFVFQRPQHLMSRFATFRRVYFIEEPIFHSADEAELELHQSKEGVTVVVPHLPEKIGAKDHDLVLQKLLDNLMNEEMIEDYAAWYYTPMALNFSRHLSPSVTIYDCMDELSKFHGAPRELLDREQELLTKADLVFTGGYSLYEAKKDRHEHVHPFPSGIDIHHFNTARGNKNDPEDQKHIPHPRMGFIGVIDERMDIDLVRQTAELRPDWNFIMIGPVVKIDPASLPQLPNIYYLGKKDYADLPKYMAGWDCALMPFARNEATRFISPTKTPEYLAAGCPVVSTPIRDVVEPYGNRKLVAIGETAQEFVAHIEEALDRNKYDADWLDVVDEFLKDITWDETWKKMAHLETHHTRLKAMLPGLKNTDSMNINFLRGM